MAQSSTEDILESMVARTPPKPTATATTGIPVSQPTGVETANGIADVPSLPSALTKHNPPEYNAIEQLSSVSVSQPSSNCVVAETTDADCPNTSQPMKPIGDAFTKESAAAVLEPDGATSSSIANPSVPYSTTSTDNSAVPVQATVHTKPIEFPAKSASACTFGESCVDLHNLPKVQAFDQVMSLKPGDDERKAISKKMTWILRHGAKKINVEIDEDGWVPLPQLRSADVLAGISEERLMTVIMESNVQKVRYELKTIRDELYIRAIAKPPRERRKRETDYSWQHTRATEGEEHSRLDRACPRIYDQQLQGRYVPVEGKGVCTSGKNSDVVRPDMHVQALGANILHKQQLRLRVVESMVIVRRGEEVHSESLAKLERGALVMQMGEEKRLENGIVRIMIESIEPQPGIRGWVTKTAADAGGPVFFELDRTWRDHPVGGRGRGKGAILSNRGRGRSQIGDGMGT